MLIYYIYVSVICSNILIIFILKYQIKYFQNQIYLSNFVIVAYDGVPAVAPRTAYEGIEFKINNNK